MVYSVWKISFQFLHSVNRKYVNPPSICICIWICVKICIRGRYIESCSFWHLHLSRLWWRFHLIYCLLLLLYLTLRWNDNFISERISTRTFCRWCCCARTITTSRITRCTIHLLIVMNRILLKYAKKTVLFIFQFEHTNTFGESFYERKTFGGSGDFDWTDAASWIAGRAYLGDKYIS